MSVSFAAPPLSTSAPASGVEHDAHRSACRSRPRRRAMSLPPPAFDRDGRRRYAGAAEIARDDRRCRCRCRCRSLMCSTCVDVELDGIGDRRGAGVDVDVEPRGVAAVRIDRDVVVARRGGDVERVAGCLGALAADHGVDAAEQRDVVVERVVAFRATVERVVAGRAGQRVVAGAAGDVLDRAARRS